MEQLPSESIQKNAYFDKLREHDCILRIEEGMNLNVSDYPLAAVPEGLEFEVEGLRESVVRFLNASTVTDSFVSHAKRVAWYNESGVLDGGMSKLYLANRLRINILLGFLNAASTYGDYFARGHARGRFHAPTKLPELTEDFSLQDYDQNSVEDKLALVARAETIAKTALNEMVEFGWIGGNKLD